MRLAVLAKDQDTGMAGVYLYPNSESDALSLVIVNPDRFGCVDQVGYFFTLDPAIPNDMLCVATPVEIQGEPLSVGNATKLKQSIETNLKGVCPYRSTPKWTELYKKILAYQTDNNKDKQTQTNYDTLCEEMKRLLKKEYGDSTKA